MPETHAAGSGFLGVAPEYLPAVVAMLLVPLILRGFLGGVRYATGRGFAPAACFLRGYFTAPLLTRIAAALLFTTAVVHMTLPLAHADAPTGMALLFVLNGVAFAGLSVAALIVRWWRPVAAVLLIATIAAYVVMVGSGREAPDQMGIATKLVELAALGFVLAPRRRMAAPGARWLGWTGATFVLLSVGVVSGGVAWGASLKPHAAFVDAEHEHATGTLPHAHPWLVVGGHQVAAPLTAGQRQAAARLVAETKAGIARYQDQTLAIADGYRPVPLGKEPTAHWENARAKDDGRTLDPTLPEQLVYAGTADGPLLLGAVYVMPRPGIAAPRVGGPLTRWHTHSICIAPLPPWIAGLVSPFGACPIGSVSIVTPEMMHVWTVDNPGGPFAEQLDEAYLREIRGR